MYSHHFGACSRTEQSLRLVYPLSETKEPACSSNTYIHSCHSVLSASSGLERIEIYGNIPDGYILGPVDVRQQGNRSLRVVKVRVPLVSYTLGTSHLTW